MPELLGALNSLLCFLRLPQTLPALSPIHGPDNSLAWHGPASAPLPQQTHTPTHAVMGQRDCRGLGSLKGLKTRQLLGLSPPADTHLSP